MPAPKTPPPAKPCLFCGQPMEWRRVLAKTWDTVKYCSTACTRQANRQRRQAGETIWELPPAPTNGRGVRVWTAKKPRTKKK
ncbi:MAG: DUF2256 domain-containing protein [Proteobacteria bacterium]|nr:DUF2256 domain-containing protein [Bacteroidota bacterium]NBX85637.1 DUF2256 domain-containing protein [Pseudomonadota bacterium]